MNGHGDGTRRQPLSTELPSSPHHPPAQPQPRLSLLRLASRPLARAAYTPPHTRLFSMVSFYDLKAQRPKGTELEFGELKGKVVLIVNTASK